MILDGIVTAVLFNTAAGLGFMIHPQEYSVMFPKEIKEAAAPYVNKQDVRKVKLFLYSLYLFLFVYWAFSACSAEVRGFRDLFLTGYIEMTFISISDFIILDCWFPSRIRTMIKGAEHCKAWERKEWLLKLAIPEHALLWTFFMCPLAGLFTAVIGMLIH